MSEISDLDKIQNVVRELEELGLLHIKEPDSVVPTSAWFGEPFLETLYM